MPDENEQDALSKIKAYLDAGHDLDAVRKAGWGSWIDHLEGKGYDVRTGQLAIAPPDARPAVETKSVKEQPASQVPNADQPIDTLPLQDEIARRSAKGWQLVSHVGTEAQMRKPKHFSFVWAFLWFLLFGVGLIVYLFWHWSKREDVVYLRMLDGHLDIASKGSPLDFVLKPVRSWWTWSGQRETTWGKAAAYGGPLGVVIILIVIISIASASGGGNGDQPLAAVQQNTSTPAAESPTATTEEPSLSGRCEDASTIASEGIAFGLTVSGGGTLRDAQAVKSDDFENVYFIAAEIDGPGMEGNGDIGLWASNSLEPGGGLIFAVDGLAKEFSDWGHGDTTDAQITMFDEGAEEAKECVSQAQG